MYFVFSLFFQIFEYFLNINWYKTWYIFLNNLVKMSFLNYLLQRNYRVSVQTRRETVIQNIIPTYNLFSIRRMCDFAKTNRNSIIPLLIRFDGKHWSDKWFRIHLVHTQYSYPKANCSNPMLLMINKLNSHFKYDFLKKINKNVLGIKLFSLNCNGPYKGRRRWFSLHFFNYGKWKEIFS